MVGFYARFIFIVGLAFFALSFVIYRGLRGMTGSRWDSVRLAAWPLVIGLPCLAIGLYLIQLSNRLP
jgi:hypothetical protein